MLYNVVPILIIFGSLALLAIVIGRRLPEIAALDLDQIPEAVTAAKKRELLVTRLNRVVTSWLRWLWEKTAALRSGAAGRLRAAERKLLALEARYRRATVPAPREAENFEPLLEQAAEAMAGGTLTEAEQLYLEVIRRDHHNFAAYRGLADVYREQRNYNDARQSLEYALRLEPLDGATYATLADLAKTEGKLDDARGAYQRAVGLAPDNIGYRIGLGDTFVELKEYGSAIATFEEAVALEPGNPRCLDRLIEVCILGGNKSLARSTLQQLKTVNPENNKLTEFDERIRAIAPKRRAATSS